MSERTQWLTAKKAFVGLHPVRVENPALPGTPDVNYVEGWVELKWRRDWPARADTVVEFDHFTNRQRIWIIERAKANGRVFVLVQVARQWMIFEPEPAVRVIGRGTREELEAAALKIWPDGLDTDELRAILVGSAA